jgi:hypothetical protein
MNLPDSRVLINQNPSFKRSRIATESSQSLTSFIITIHHHSHSSMLLAIATTGHCDVTSFSSGEASAT